MLICSHLSNRILIFYLRNLRNLREIFICEICVICERHPLKRVKFISILQTINEEFEELRLNPLKRVKFISIESIIWLSVSAESSVSIPSNGSSLFQYNAYAILTSKDGAF